MPDEKPNQPTKPSKPTRAGSSREAGTRRPTPGPSGPRPERKSPAAEAAPAGAVRLQKLLAQAGIASRRAAEEIIRDGRVKIDGRVVAKMGVTVDPAASVVTFDGRRVLPPARHTYLLLNKPARVVCTMSDPEGRRTVRDLLPPGLGRVYPVGRLDWDAEGVLLLTDDGDLANRLMHPRFAVERTYHVKVKGRMEQAAMARLESGVYLEDGRARAENVRFLRRTSENSWVALTLREGRHHEVKRMCLAVGHPVQKIHRVSYAGVEIGRLPLGHLRPLTPGEVGALKKAASGTAGAAAR
jgi:23S rRNA pseudouridine2605 synthase